MKANDLLVIMTVALGTAALTVLGLWPATVDAGNDPAPPAKIPTPKLVSRGIEMTLKTVDGKVPKAGEPPVFELTAISLTNLPSQVCARVTMSASSPADALSRAIRMPATFWVDDREFTLGPGETKRFTLTCGTNLPPNKFVSVSLQEVPAFEALPLTAALLPGRVGARGQVPASSIGIIALNFSTVVPAPTAGLMTSR
jgi:hypothetical protein